MTTQEKAELIRRLATAAGMLMEDMSAVAVTMPVHDSQATRNGLERLRHATGDMATAHCCRRHRVPAAMIQGIEQLA